MKLAKNNTIKLAKKITMVLWKLTIARYLDIQRTLFISNNFESLSPLFQLKTF